MTPRRWIVPVLLALVLATGLALQGGAVVNAAGPGTFTWTGSFWKDPTCGTTDQKFRVRLYQHVNYGGTRWDLCSDWSDFCWVPHGRDSSSSLLCQAGYDGTTLNDYPSSIKVIGVRGGYLCRVQFYEHPGWSKQAVAWWDPVDVPTLVPWPNDVWSSVRRVCT